LTTSILLIRHGQTEWNRVERFRGQFDIELNQNGFTQAKRTASWIIGHWQPTAVISSPLIRAIQTAEAIAKSCSLVVQANPGLTDIDYGDWQGLTPDEVKEKWPNQASAWFGHPSQTDIPGGESLSQVQSRAIETISAISQEFENQVIVAVSHTVVIRLIILGLMGISLDHFWHIHQDPCGINLFEVQGKERKIVFLNATCHLDKKN